MDKETERLRDELAMAAMNALIVAGVKRTLWQGIRHRLGLRNTIDSMRAEPLARVAYSHADWMLYIRSGAATAKPND